MIDGPLTTAEQFLEQRYEMPEGGQWSELLDGKTHHLQPPDPDHGNAVFNLSKALADYIQQTKIGYACFDLGLHIAKQPDSVLFPAACIFTDGPLFAESDKELTETCPAVIVEIKSTSDRAALIKSRVKQYHEWGVESVWVMNPKGESVELHTSRSQVQSFQGTDEFAGDPILEEFKVVVLDLYKEPDWWANKPS